MVWRSQLGLDDSNVSLTETPVEKSLECGIRSVMWVHTMGIRILGNWIQAKISPAEKFGCGHFNRTSKRHGTFQKIKMPAPKSKVPIVMIMTSACRSVCKTKFPLNTIKIDCMFYEALGSTNISSTRDVHSISPTFIYLFWKKKIKWTNKENIIKKDRSSPMTGQESYQSIQSLYTPPSRIL